MAENGETAAPSKNVKDLVVPLTMIGGLLLLTWQGGIRVGELASEISAQRAILQEIRSFVNPVERAKLDAKVESEISRLRDDLEETNDELRLLKDFTEGRIGSLPYRSDGK